MLPPEPEDPKLPPPGIPLVGQFFLGWDEHAVVVYRAPKKGRPIPVAYFVELDNALAWVLKKVTLRQRRSKAGGSLAALVKAHRRAVANLEGFKVRYEAAAKVLTKMALDNPSKLAKMDLDNPRKLAKMDLDNPRKLE